MIIFKANMAGPYHIENGLPCQDSFAISHGEGFSVLAVADGLGSELYSDTGSAVAAQTAVEYCSEHAAAGMPFGELKKVMNNCLVTAYKAVLTRAAEDGNDPDEYDTTLCLAIYDGERLSFAQSGDSGLRSSRLARQEQDRTARGGRRGRGHKELRLTLLGSGGEGAVYEIQGYPDRVAKIYHSGDAAERSKREAKVNAMVAISQSFAFKRACLSDDIAWPMAPLYDRNGAFVGFGMDRIKATTELNDLYAYPPKDQTVTIRDKVRCLISLCDVIDRLHQTGQVFGDFNPNNIKIDPKTWSVTFVDADSFGSLF